MKKSLQLVLINDKFKFQKCIFVCSSEQLLTMQRGWSFLSINVKLKYFQSVHLSVASILLKERVKSEFMRPFQ